MSEIQYKPGRDSNSSTQDKGWSVATNDRDAIKLLIQQANTADLLTIFKSYGINITDGYGWNKITKICCPLPGHNDRSPSFFYYGETNSFNCFGCGVGGKAVRLVSVMEKLTNEQSARKILDNYYVDNDVEINNQKDYFDRQIAILDFSAKIRTFITDNSCDDEAIKYAEKLTLAFDTLNEKHKMEADGLKKIIETLGKRLENY
jgi:hypothetical protein